MSSRFGIFESAIVLLTVALLLVVAGPAAALRESGRAEGAAVRTLLPLAVEAYAAKVAATGPDKTYPGLTDLWKQTGRPAGEGKDGAAGGYRFVLFRPGEGGRLEPAPEARTGGGGEFLLVAVPRSSGSPGTRAYAVDARLVVWERRDDAPAPDLPLPYDRVGPGGPPVPDFGWFPAIGEPLERIVRRALADRGLPPPLSGTEPE